MSLTPPPKVRFLVLGPMSVSVGEDVEVLRPSRVTSLLYAMLLEANRVVSVNWMQRVLWDDALPENARATIHTYVMRLRRLFARYGSEGPGLETVAGGYRFSANATNLDLLRFRELVQEAARTEDSGREAALLTEALQLWQGQPGANIDSCLVHSELVAPLLEERLRARERLFDLDLMNGRHREALPELKRAARAHPLHERFAEQFIEALFRAGRRVEALAECQSVRSLLRHEYGVEPGRGLQRLELAIHNGDECAFQPTERRATRALSAARLAAGNGNGAADRSSSAASPAELAGREDLCASLLDAIGEPGRRIFVLSGAPGIGKSAVARRLAGLAAASGAFGRVSLRDGAGAEEDWPITISTAASAVARFLILDDVPDAEESVAALDEARWTKVLVVSRSTLTPLVVAHHAGALRVRELDLDRDSRAVLESVLGPERLAKEPAAVAELIELCRGYPPLLAQAARRLLLRPRHQVIDLVDAFEADPVGALGADDADSLTPVRRMREHLDRLDPGLADRFHTLAGLGSAAFGPQRAAAEWGLSLGRCVWVLDLLIEASLVEDLELGRYRVPPFLCLLSRAVRDPLAPIPEHAAFPPRATGAER